MLIILIKYTLFSTKYITMSSLLFQYYILDNYIKSHKKYDYTVI